MTRTISAVLEIVPARVARMPSGTLFLPERATCAHPERFARVTRFLQWLTPLFSLSRDEQRELGLISAGRSAEGGLGAEEGEAIDGDNAAWDLEERIS